MTAIDPLIRRPRWVGGLVLMGLVFVPPPAAQAQGTATETVGFEINIDPVFSVETVSERHGNVELGPLLPDGRTATETVRVTVHTNNGRPYQIIQRMQQRFLSERGSEFDASQILFSVSDGAGGGLSEVKSPAPIGPEPRVIFRSGPEGERDEFTITYLTKGGRIIPAGTYLGQILIEGELR